MNVDDSSEPSDFVLLGSATTPPASNGRLTAEQLPVGELIDLGGYHVTRAEIIDFASRWDPQPFHVDEEAARDTIFRDVIGSGLHTMAIFQRLAVIGAYRHWAIVAGRAIRDVSLTGPLRPDTTVHATLSVESVASGGNERALVPKRGQVRHGDRVLMTLLIDAYVLRGS